MRFASSSSSVNMIVTSTPAPDLALTNLAYCSHSDLHGFAVPGKMLYLASVGDLFVLSVAYPSTVNYFKHMDSSYEILVCFLTA